MKPCSACIHSVSEEINGPAGKVEAIFCRRFPPQVMLVGTEMRSIFPGVRADFTCGEWTKSVCIAARKAT